MAERSCFPPCVDSMGAVMLHRCFCGLWLRQPAAVQKAVRFGGPVPLVAEWMDLESRWHADGAGCDLGVFVEDLELV